MKDDQLAAARDERIEAAARGVVHDRIEAGVDRRHVAIEIESLPVPIGAEHPFEETAEGWLIVDRGLQERPAERVGHFAARQPAEIARLAVAGCWPRKKGAGPPALSLGQGRVPPPPRAL